MNTIYQSIADVEAQIVEPALGEHADDYDIRAIAEAITEWHDEYDDHGNILLNNSGLIEIDDIDFWAIAQANEK